MNDRTVSDEMLMAMADGEVSGEEAEAILRLAESDPDVRSRLEEFRRTRSATRDAFAPVLEETPPARLATAIGRPRTGWRAALEESPEHRSIASWMALAASLVAAAGIGYWAGGAGKATPWVPALDGSLLAAVSSAPSGQVATVDIAGTHTPFEVLATFAVEDGVCRVFTLGGGNPLRAVACNGGAGWTLALAAAEGGSTYNPASDGAVQTVEAWLDVAGAGPALSLETEADLIGRHWPVGPD